MKKINNTVFIKINGIQCLTLKKCFCVKEINLKTIINELDDTGFLDVKSVSTKRKKKSAKSISEELKNSLPPIYRTAIEYYEDRFKRSSLRKAANNITLYINSRYSNTPISKSWIENGRIPYFLGKGLGTTYISNLASDLIKTKKNIKREEFKLMNIENKKKIIKRDTQRIDKIDERLKKLISRKEKIQDDFYYKFLDLESSLAGGF